jgi:hypothetical protein
MSSTVLGLRREHSLGFAAEHPPLEIDWPSLLKSLSNLRMSSQFIGHGATPSLLKSSGFQMLNNQSW